MYLRDGDRFIVTSENFGQQRPAAWPLNLLADPAATVQVGSDVVPCRARLLDDTEADVYWPRLVEVWPAHESYLARSGERHTFVLEPYQLPHRT
jgi:deazaflavin-dependent oxidoreductase (nitroreductase family)